MNFEPSVTWIAAGEMDAHKPYLISFAHDHLLFEFAQRHGRFPLLNAAGWLGWYETSDKKRRKAAEALRENNYGRSLKNEFKTRVPWVSRFAAGPGAWWGRGGTDYSRRYPELKVPRL
jgi:hypothetical protein